MMGLWLVWLALGILGLVAVHESAHALTTRLLGGRFLGMVWDLPRGRVGVRIDVTGLTPAQIRWTLAAAPLAEAVWVALVLAGHPALLPWWRFLLPLHWLANWLPVGTTDGARFWATWRRAD